MSTKRLAITTAALAACGWAWLGAAPSIAEPAPCSAPTSGPDCRQTLECRVVDQGTHIKRNEKVLRYDFQGERFVSADKWSSVNLEEIRLEPGIMRARWREHQPFQRNQFFVDLPTMRLFARYEFRASTTGKILWQQSEGTCVWR